MRGFIVIFNLLFWIVPSTARSQAPQLASTPENVFEAAQLLLQVRDGIPPDLPLATSVSQRYLGHVERLTQVVSAQFAQSTAACRRFTRSYLRLHDQIAHLVDVLAGPAKLEADRFVLVSSRLQVLVGLAALFHRFIENKAEGGLSILTRTSADEQCGIADRERWAQLAKDLTHDAKLFAIARLGTPGLREMGETEDALIRLVGKKSASDRRIFWISLAVGTLISILIWELAPVAGAFLFRIAPAEMSRGALLGLRFGGITAEMMAYSYIDNHLLFVEDQVVKSRRMMLTWSQFMDSMESIMATPINSPRLYYDAIQQLYSQMSLARNLALGPWRRQLGQLERQYGSIDQYVRAHTLMSAP